jgi:hypothetical protein
MTSKDSKVERFWEEKVRAEDGTEVTVVSSDDYGDWLTPVPVFQQRGVYETKIKVFEKYINVDDANKEDDVPVIDGVVRIQNDLAIDNKINEHPINSLGETSYSFIGGLPNTATGGAGDFQKSMTVSVFTGKNGSKVTNWPSGGVFQGYLLGSMPTGNNFVTVGPKIVSMIIRDPHGSGSYSYYEEGNTSSEEISWSSESGETVDVEAKVLLGQDITTFAGIGAGTIFKTSISNDIGVGINRTSTIKNDTSEITKVTNTKKWSTSSDPFFVGENGDVFIGNSSNIVYGKNVNLKIIPDSQCDIDAKCVDVSAGGGTYNIGLNEGIRMSPEFSTAFQFSQSHIENYLIPNLTDLRNNFYLKKRNTDNGNGLMEYVCQVCPGEADYGKDNGTFTRRADDSGIDGDSYSINYPAAWPADSMYTDSLAW